MVYLLKMEKKPAFGDFGNQPTSGLMVIFHGITMVVNGI